ncbi:MAG: zinc metalloprotease HtpX [Streptococcus sp.]
MIIGGIYAFSMIFQSTEVVMRMNGAREVTEEQAPQLYHIVQDMAMVAQIPMPRVYIVDDPSMNAFATGSNPQNAAVAATTGLLAVMNREELEGVIGHEVSHILQLRYSHLYDCSCSLVSAITMLSSIGGRMMWWGGGRSRDDDREGSGGLEIVMLILSLLAIVLAPLAATLVQLAISRQREFLADASSVELTRNPQGMINALLKLDNSEPMQRHVDDASSALLSTILKKNPAFKSFYTHPPIAERVERLRNM